MKSKVKLLGTLAISAISVLSYVQISHSEKLDDLLLENIEALAAGESGSDGQCLGSGSIQDFYILILVRKHYACGK